VVFSGLVSYAVVGGVVSWSSGSLVSGAAPVVVVLGGFQCDLVVGLGFGGGGTSRRGSRWAVVSSGLISWASVGGSSSCSGTSRRVIWFLAEKWVLRGRWVDLRSSVGLAAKAVVWWGVGFVVDAYSRVGSVRGSRRRSRLRSEGKLYDGWGSGWVDSGHVRAFSERDGSTLAFSQLTRRRSSWDYKS
jgi:hypothetical protein